jgi:hypothetical protein
LRNTNTGNKRHLVAHYRTGLNMEEEEEQQQQQQQQQQQSDH